MKNGLSLALTFRHWPLRWGVLLRAGRVLMVVTLMTMIGGHWALLQTIAWTGMMADHLQTSSVCDALSTTLDGKHPCPLCKAIAAAKETQRKQEFTSSMLRFEFPLMAANPALIPPTRFDLLPHCNDFASAVMREPLTPPPRSFPG